MTGVAQRLDSPGWRSLRHPVTASVLTAAVLQGLWWIFLATGGGDLAAQDAWADFVKEHPGSAYNLAWYGGIHPASYSVISPYLMAVLGVPATAVLAGTLSAALAAVLLMRSGFARPLFPAVWAAVGLSANVVSGRVTFALGVFFALAAVAMVCGIREPRISLPTRAAATISLSVLATMASPLAGLFIVVVAVALFFVRARKSAYALAAGPTALFAVSALFFPLHDGRMPMPAIFTILPAGAAIALALFAPKSWRVVRIGSAVYAIGVILTLLVPSAVGSNVERLALLFGGVLLLMAALDRRSRTLYVAFAVVAVWQVVKPIDDLATSVPAAALSRESEPLIEELHRLGADRGRVEVVPSRSHRESTVLAPHVNLARGWNRQMDIGRNELFYDDSLTPEKYQEWLREWAVHYVVLPEADPDLGADLEADIVATEPLWLKRVWEDKNWRLYRVADPTPLADPPAVVERATGGEITVRVPEASTILVRVPWSRWLGILSEQEGCLAPVKQGETPVSKGDWTELRASEEGVYKIGARYRKPRGSPCENTEN